MSKWIKISERSPSIGGDYFVKINTNRDSIAMGICECYKEFKGTMLFHIPDSLTREILNANYDPYVIEWLDENE